MQVRPTLELNSIGFFDMTLGVPAARRRLCLLWDPFPFASSTRSWQTLLHANGPTVRRSSVCEGIKRMTANLVDIMLTFFSSSLTKTGPTKLESKHVVHNSNISGCQPGCQRWPSDECCCHHIYSLVLYHPRSSLFLPAIHTGPHRNG